MSEQEPTTEDLATALEQHGNLRTRNIAADRLRELQAIVDKLPKCGRLSQGGNLVRDKPLVPGMSVLIGDYYDMSGEVDGCRSAIVMSVCEDHCWLQWGPQEQDVWEAHHIYENAEAHAASEIGTNRAAPEH